MKIECKDYTDLITCTEDPRCIYAGKCYKSKLKIETCESLEAERCLKEFGCEITPSGCDTLGRICNPKNNGEEC